MITFLFLGAGLILIIALVVVAYGANQRKRSSQSAQTEVVKQQEGSSPRATGDN